LNNEFLRLLAEYKKYKYHTFDEPAAKQVEFEIERLIPDPSDYRRLVLKKESARSTEKGAAGKRLI
jgi:hypothetical protein